MAKGIGSITDIMKQAQEIQGRLQQVQEEAAARTVEASAGGGMVSATVSGKLEVVALRIEKAVVEGGDLEMLQDLIIAAVNQAVRAAQKMMADEMSKVTGGLKIPGLS